MLLKGRRIYLRPISEKDDKILLRWRNAAHVSRNSFSGGATTSHEHAKWMSSVLDGRRRVTYVIALTGDKTPIGRIGLKNIDFYHKRAELEKLIGEIDYQGKGYATEAGALFLGHVFKKIGLSRVYAYVLEFNKANIRVNKKLGFKVEGRLRKHCYKNGEFVDILYMALLKGEFLKKGLSLCRKS